MSREITETPSNSAEIDLDRVVIDPAYRREVLSQLRVSQMRHGDPAQPAGFRAPSGEEN
jgi:hypothetical protein